MRSPRLWGFLCLLALSSRLGLSARYGCLFEKKLCPRDQLCSDDGLFGQCQAPHQGHVQYQVSVPVLRRLQEVIKDLMVQGLSWQNDITQLIIGREMSQIPQIHPASKPPSKSLNVALNFPSQLHRIQGLEEQDEPGLRQQYLDYMVLDHPQSSVHMQNPLLDPYSYRQQQYGYQEDDERSLNSVDDGRAFSLMPPALPRAGARGGARPLDQDQQLLQDLVSLSLSSSSSSSTTPRHRGALSAAAGLPASNFFPEVDFPLDYSEDYDSQDAGLSQQRQGEQEGERAQKYYDPLAGLDERSTEKLARLLDHYGIDLKDLSPDQLDNLPTVLKQLQLESSYSERDPKGKYGNNAVAQKKIAEGDMIYKVEKAPAEDQSLSLALVAKAPPAPVKSPEAGALPAPSHREPAAISAAKVVKEGPSGPAGGVSKAEEEYGYIVTNQSPLSLNDGVRLLELLAERLHLSTSSFTNISVVGPALTFRVQPNPQNLTVEDVAGKAVGEKNFLESETGLKILQTGVGESARGLSLPLATRVTPGSRWVFATLVAIACVGAVLVAAMTVACLRHHAHRLAARKLGLGPEGGAISHQEYQDLCRQHMASKGAFGRLEAAALGAVGGPCGGGNGGGGGGGGLDTSQVSSVSSQFSDGAQASPSSHSSTPSWCEEPAQANMDISTGHMILAYMEDHLRNKDRLMKEWEALCSYQAEPSAVSVAQSEANAKKNRCPDSVPYDHSRVRLKAEVNPSRADYINASTIIEHDPRMPAYIATQGPLSHTISDFWQMVWESGCTVIVMMTALVEDGEKQCDRYWPDEGSSLYHIYEVNLVSEHIWCNDFLVRSFYLKNVQTQETRTLTQFHFLSWPAQGIPTSTRPLLDFRRKVNKCYRGRSCPIIVHCSDGTGRTGTYILIDMVLNRMAKGVKEIDIAATLEHVRDQRPGMVRTKDQFEFALTAVAEEVNAILKALPQ
ncbi:receptor-type tyrosine-protein phosphatase-like N [Lampris incognitus]|uniref:receptor-type tyrosine-protein phosphatase-like N n=1 Tax=Lampris incognitus TaxID=2546036 RepID=UPI0024B522BB|nr:receptor-type tyrosine-protein phosphatase-like N [Lampris incognitus]